MIVSFEHRFVFVAIPKTATHALRAALRPHLGRHDWEQCTLFEQKRFPVAPLAELEHGHLTCQQVRPFLLRDFWESSLRFCVVRNPYDRFASSCRFLNRHNSRMRDDPLGTMKATIADPRVMRRLLLRPQVEFVTDADGSLLVGRVGRFETLQRDFDAVCGALGLPATPLARVNHSGEASAPAPYDRELIEAVQAAYARDFERFGYDRAPVGSSNSDR
jgi:hypothetical protein